MSVLLRKRGHRTEWGGAHRPQKHGGPRTGHSEALRHWKPGLPVTDTPRSPPLIEVLKPLSFLPRGPV